MDENLIEKFIKYSNTEEGYAILFVKKYLNASKGYWVDIIDCNKYRYSDNPLAFKNVTCELFKRNLKPKYPPKSQFTHDGKFDERSYIMMVRAITWETANRDIEKQRNRNVKGKQFYLRGVSYPKKKNGFFIDSAPEEIKQLEKNVNDRTDPLWYRAMGYIAQDTFVYEFKSVKKLN